MSIDQYSGGNVILPPRRATTLPSNTPREVRRVADSHPTTAEGITQQAIAQSGGAVVSLANFTQGAAAAPSSAGGSQTATIAVVDDVAAPEVYGQVIPFNDMARRRLLGIGAVAGGSSVSSASASALPERGAAGPEDAMPFVREPGETFAAAPEEKKTSVLPWVIAGAAIIAVLWKFSQDSSLQGAPLVAELDDDGDDEDTHDAHEASETAAQEAAEHQE